MTMKWTGLLLTIFLAGTAHAGPFAPIYGNDGASWMWDNMVDTTKADTALSVTPIATVANTGQREALRGNGVTLTSAAWSYTSVQDGSDMDDGVLFLSWANNFTDSMIVVVRRHWDLDVTVSYAVDLDPSTPNVVDSVLAHVKDTGGLGGTATLSLVDRSGAPLYLPRYSIGFYHDGTGNVTTLKADLEKRRDW
jgi:hypothetical protein